MPIATAIYARISKDELDTELGVTRQIVDCQREADRRGWVLAGVYTDNDTSASDGKNRCEYDRMLEDIRARRVGAITVWDLDRLSRTPRELEDLIDLADQYGLHLANVGGDIDLSTEDGRMMARIKGTVARREVEQSSKRLKRKFDELADDGKPQGRIAYGYRRVVDYDDRGRRVGSHDELDPIQADVIKQTAKRLLAGESMRSVAATLNASGVTSPGGGHWQSTTLREVMLRARNAGLRRHRGQVYGKAAWEPIYDEDTHNRVVSLLTDPSRQRNRGATRKHLLTGLATCGLCGTGMKLTVASGRLAAKYQCAGCTRVARKQSDLDDCIRAVVVERLSRPDAVEALATGRPERASELQDAIAATEARLALAADGYADGEVTGDQLKRITAKLTPKIEEWKRELASCAPRTGLLDLTGPDSAELWDAAPLDVQRGVIGTLMEITVLPSGRGYRFDPDRHLRIDWKSDS